jgi:hypothetical protein
MRPESPFIIVNPGWIFLKCQDSCISNGKHTVVSTVCLLPYWDNINLQFRVTTNKGTGPSVAWCSM